MIDKVSHIYASKDQFEFPDFTEFLSVYDIVIWKPSLTRIVPPGYSWKYIFYWLAHYCRVFSNSKYAAVYIYENGVRVSSMLIMPAYFKWPFMGKNDIQFCYSMTKESHRGKGINTLVKLYTMYSLNDGETRFWGVVDPENKSNLRVFRKVGLEFYSEAKRKKILLFPLLYRINPITKNGGE